MTKQKRIGLGFIGVVVGGLVGLIYAPRHKQDSTPTVFQHQNTSEMTIRAEIAKMREALSKHHTAIETLERLPHDRKVILNAEERAELNRIGLEAANRMSEATREQLRILTEKRDNPLMTCNNSVTIAWGASTIYRVNLELNSEWEDLSFADMQKQIRIADLSMARECKDLGVGI